MKFSSDVAGKVTGVRFHKWSTANGGTHVGNLWDASGRKLATVQFAQETSSGWQTANFSAPVAIAANTTYVISYYAPKGHYSATEKGLSSAVHAGPLHVPASGGVYVYGTGGFPNQTYNGSNYWVDLLFVPDQAMVAPRSATIVTGSLSSGSATSLASNDEAFLKVASTTASPYTAAWSASFAGIPSSATSLSVTYSGKNSISCSETTSIWSFKGSKWVALDTRSVGTTEVTRVLPVSGVAADYISAAEGEVRVMVGCTSSSGKIAAQADLVRVSYK
jgi:hypothetical protein